MAFAVAASPFVVAAEPVPPSASELAACKEGLRQIRADLTELSKNYPLLKGIENQQVVGHIETVVDDTPERGTANVLYLLLFRSGLEPVDAAPVVAGTHGDEPKGARYLTVNKNGIFLAVFINKGTGEGRTSAGVRRVELPLSKEQNLFLQANFMLSADNVELEAAIRELVTRNAELIAKRLAALSVEAR